MLNQEQLNFAVKCMSEWTRICEDNDRSIRPGSVDIDHSALLGYLLRGNRPFEKPPPLRYSYPCYALAEGKEVRIGELWGCGSGEGEEFKIVIDQTRAWNWHNKEKGILVHKDGDLYKFREGTAEEIIDTCIFSTETHSRDWHIADQQKIMDKDKAKGVLTGFLQRCDGEAPRKK